MEISNEIFDFLKTYQGNIVLSALSAFGFYLTAWVTITPFTNWNKSQEKAICNLIALVGGFTFAILLFLIHRDHFVLIVSFVAVLLWQVIYRYIDKKYISPRLENKGKK